MGESQSSSKGRSGPSFATIVLVALLAAGVIGALVGVVIVRVTESDVAALTLEPANAAGANPFTDSVAAGGPAVNPNTQTAVAATRASFTTDPDTGALIAPANAPGLYGGSGDTKVCNPQQLVEFLAQDEAKAKAWASVLDISPNDIAGYVASLTPVLLTNDTLVTNHGYKNGKATALQSVLQAGTAVMVDATGTPRIKCNCGNPLNEPQTITLSTAKLTGTAWPNYTINNFTTIHTTTQITNLIIINIQTGTTYTQPLPTPYTPGEHPDTDNPDNNTGGIWVAAHAIPAVSGRYAGGTVIETSPDGKTWTKVGTVDDAIFMGLAYGNGVWVAVAADGPVYESDDLANWRVVAETDALGDAAIAFGNGRWMVVSGTNGASMSSPLAYTSTDATTWTEVSINSDSDASYQTLSSIAFGDGAWTAIGQDGRAMATYRSTDGTALQASGPPLVVPDGSGERIAFHDDVWTISVSIPRTSATSTASQIYQSSDGSSWAPAQVSTPFARPLNALAGGDSGLLAVSNDNSQGNAGGSSTFYTSLDGKAWTQAGQLDTSVTALAWGGSGATSSGSTDTTVAGGPPCTVEALQAGLNGSTIPPGAHTQCNGTWAAIAGVIFNDSGGDEGNAVLRANGNAWMSGGSCNDPDIPPDIYQVACTSS